MENIIIEGKGIVSTYGDIQDKEIDIEYFNESLLNKMYFLTIYEADEDLNKKEKIGQIEMTYMDIWLAESLDYSIFMLFDMIDADKQDVGRYLFDSYEEKNDNYVGMDKDVLYIDKIYIEKKYSFYNIDLYKVCLVLLPIFFIAITIIYHDSGPRGAVNNMFSKNELVSCKKQNSDNYNVYYCKRRGESFVVGCSNSDCSVERLRRTGD